MGQQDGLSEKQRGALTHRVGAKGSILIFTPSQVFLDKWSPNDFHFAKFLLKFLSSKHGENGCRVALRSKGLVTWMSVSCDLQRSFLDKELVKDSSKETVT